MPKQLRNPFALIRQAISHAKFDDKETRERVNALLDEMELDLDAIDFDFIDENTLSAIAALQEHLIELLSTEEELEEKEEVRRKEVTSVRGGELEDDDEDNN